MQINLNPQQAQILQTLSEQGGYDSLEVTLDAALLSLAEQIALPSTLTTSDYQAWLEDTRLKLAEGYHAADRGELLDAEEVIEQLQAKLTAARSPRP